MDNIIEVNNLKSFGAVFQAKCLAVLISDRAFLERITEGFFRGDNHKIPIVI